MSIVKELLSDQKKQMEQMMENQKKFFDQMLKVRKAEKREFLNIWAAHLNVNTGRTEDPNNDDTSNCPLMYKGFDLMTLYASEKPSILGRELARRLFGQGEVCELILLILGKKTSRASGRKPCDHERYQLFKGKFYSVSFTFNY